MAEDVVPKTKSHNENLQGNAHNSENAKNPLESRQNVEEGRRKDEVVVNLSEHDERRKGVNKLWRNGRHEERAPDEETRKHRESTDGGGGGGGERSMFRNDFVASVFLRVFIMLLITAAITGGIMNTSLKKTLFKNPILNIIILVVICVVLIAVQFSMMMSECARRGPCSYVLLLITVVALGILCANACLRFKLKIIYYALIATCVCVVLCYLLALTSFDFTSWLLYVLVIGMAIAVVSLLLFGLTMLTGEGFTVISIILLFASTIITLIMFVIELQMVLGGRSVELDEDDYNLGAFLIYTSIVSLFLKLLEILGILDSLSGD